MNSPQDPQAPYPCHRSKDRSSKGRARRGSGLETDASGPRAPGSPWTECPWTGGVAYLDAEWTVAASPVEAVHFPKGRSLEGVPRFRKVEEGARLVALEQLRVVAHLLPPHTHQSHLSV